MRSRLVTFEVVLEIESRPPPQPLHVNHRMPPAEKIGLDEKNNNEDGRRKK